MKKVLDVFLSCLYLLFFGLCLAFFHVVQVIAFNIFGKEAHLKSVNLLNFFLTYGTILTGASITYKPNKKLAENTSYIFVANHQSMFDIPGLIWFLRKYKPLFVSKKELSKGIPSISYNLRVGGAALIDRQDRTQALKEIIRLGRYAKENFYSVAIFPEGTRSRSYKLKQFASGGIAALTKTMPDALIVPVAIENTGKFNPVKLFPLRSFVPLRWTVLEAIDPKGKSPEEIALACENAIKAVVEA